MFRHNLAIFDEDPDKPCNFCSSFIFGPSKLLSDPWILLMLDWSISS